MTQNCTMICYGSLQVALTKTFYLLFLGFGHISEVLPSMQRSVLQVGEGWWWHTL